MAHVAVNCVLIIRTTQVAPPKLQGELVNLKFLKYGGIDSVYPSSQGPNNKLSHDCTTAHVFISLITELK